MHPHRRASRIGLLAVVLAIVVVALLVNLPVPARATTVGPAAASRPAAVTPYQVTWNGVDVSTAGTASSALSIDLTQSANLNYVWNTSASAPVVMSDARLQMFYFGFALTTRDQTLTSPVASSAGHIPLSWTPVSVSYVLGGVYRLTASFIAQNGTTLWSENFYVRGTAPLGFVALIPIVLLLIVVYEVYGLVRSGRYAALGRKTTPSPPPETPPATPPPTETPAPSAPSEPSAPPSGGSP